MKIKDITFLAIELFVAVSLLFLLVAYSDETPKNTYFAIAFLCVFFLFLFNVKDFIKKYYLKKD